MRYLSILILVMSTLINNVANASIDVHSYIPHQAFQYFETIKKESDHLLPGFEYPYYFAGLIEHESCISLQHRRCWNPNSKLETKREFGIGLGQITKTYNADGSIRFDVLSDLRRAHMEELKELSWSNVQQRPDLQIRAILIMSRANYKALFKVSDTYERLAMADCSYNAGLGSVQKDRRYCGMKENCDPDKWFGNVEINSLKSRKPIYGTRSAFDISRNHVRKVLLETMSKYKPYFE